MGFPAYGQRTPVVGLKVESDDTRNFNWSKLDDTIGRAFTEGSPLQLPPDAILPPLSVGAAQVQPGAITSESIFPGESVPGYALYGPIAGQLVCLLNTPTAVATIPALSGNPRHGPTLVTGTLPLTFSNTTAAPASAAFNVDLTLYGTATPLVHFQGFILAPNTVTPLIIPILVMVQAPVVQSTTVAVLRVTKTTGADAQLQLQTGDAGSMQVSELA